MSSFSEGVKVALEGFRWVFKPGLRLFAVIPIMLNILVFVGLIYFGGLQSAQWIESIVTSLPDWLAFVDWLLWIVFGLLVVLALFYGFVTVANFIGAPFYGLLSEQVEIRYTGTPPPGETGWQAMVKTIPASLSREVSKQIYYLPRALGLLILGFIPLINTVAPVFWVLFSGWMMALQYVDFPIDNRQRPFSSVKQFVRQHRMACFGFGLVIFVTTLIPIVNLVALPAAVCGATLFYLRENAPQAGGGDVQDELC